MHPLVGDVSDSPAPGSGGDPSDGRYPEQEGPHERSVTTAAGGVGDHVLDGAGCATRPVLRSEGPSQEKPRDLRASTTDASSCPGLPPAGDSDQDHAAGFAPDPTLLDERAAEETK